jgi:Ca2+-transporting ATPase
MESGTGEVIADGSRILTVNTGSSSIKVTLYRVEGASEVPELSAVAERIGARGGNKSLLGAVALTFALQLLAMYAPFFQRFLETEALSLADLAIAVALGSITFWAVEFEKWLVRKNSPEKGHGAEDSLR